MENKIIKKTKYTPEINFDLEENILSIKGNSYPENTLEFYEPILELLEDFFLEKKDKKVVLNLFKSIF